jgi:hypothetical protein
VGREAFGQFSIQKSALRISADTVLKHFQTISEVVSNPGSRRVSSSRRERPESRNDAFDNVQIRVSDGSVIFSPGLFADDVQIEDATYRLFSIDGGIKYRGFSFDAEHYRRRIDSFTHAPRASKNEPEQRAENLPAYASLRDGSDGQLSVRTRTKGGGSARRLGPSSEGLVARPRRLRMTRGLEFVERHGQPFQSTIGSEQVEMQRGPVRQQQALIAVSVIGFDVTATGRAVVDA